MICRMENMNNKREYRMLVSDAISRIPECVFVEGRTILIQQLEEGICVTFDPPILDVDLENPSLTI